MSDMTHFVGDDCLPAHNPVMDVGAFEEMLARSSTETIRLLAVSLWHEREYWQARAIAAEAAARARP